MNSVMELELKGDALACFEIAQSIEAIRQRIKPAPSHRQWSKLWPGLGSPKTYGKVIRGDFAQLDAGKQLVKYRAVLAAMEANSEERSIEEVYQDLPKVEEAQIAALALARHHGTDRMISIEGGSGSGKSTILRILSEGALAGSIFIAEASETWKSPRAALYDMLRALSVSDDEIPASLAARQSLLIKILKRRGKLFLAIDESHHCTGPVLNILKSLLNQSPVMVIIAGVATLLSKLKSAAAEESKQLFHNRLYARIVLGRPCQEGALKFLTRRLDGGKWSAGTISKLNQTAEHFGHYAFLRKTVDLLRDQGLSGAEVDDALLIQTATQAMEEIR